MSTTGSKWVITNCDELRVLRGYRGRLRTTIWLGVAMGIISNPMLLHLQKSSYIYIVLKYRDSNPPVLARNLLFLGIIFVLPFSLQNLPFFVFFERVKFVILII